MLTRNIFFQNFRIKKVKLKEKKKIIETIKKEIGKEDNLLFSFTEKYKLSYNRKKIVELRKKFSVINLIGMGGSVLGSKAIYSFLKNKIKKNFIFFDNLITFRESLKNKNKKLNVVISKSGNTLETIVNTNIYLKKNHKNLFITENNKNYIRDLATNLKAEIIDHKNYIGGRYSVLSEAGMLPAELMGLNVMKFKRMNYLIKKTKFIHSLCENVEKTLYLIKKNKLNSIILNYDDRSKYLFKWYQQLLSESLGKKSKGILPFVSSMPEDNHSLLQLYLDGPKNNFFTFFYVFDKKSNLIKNKKFLNNINYLNNKKVSQIIYIQKIATQNIFLKKNIPFRSMEILNRNEEALGEIFCFFVLETILLGRALKVNPFDQPSVELVKKETKRIFIK
tara:strand:+ start:1324 stop:2499 length:1176 start_codon:yes stop_codon:yes gene_type:complete